MKIQINGATIADIHWHTTHYYIYTFEGIQCKLRTLSMRSLFRCIISSNECYPRKHWYLDKIVSCTFVRKRSDIFPFKDLPKYIKF